MRFPLYKLVFYSDYYPSYLWSCTSIRDPGELQNYLTEETQIYHAGIKLYFTYSVYAKIEKIGRRDHLNGLPKSHSEINLPLLDLY